jgi:hypothetical protein
VFVVTLRAPPDGDPMHELRALLKRLLRAHRWQCVDLREAEKPATNQEQSPV